jgi:hypothetical protein
MFFWGKKLRLMVIFYRRHGGSSTDSSVTNCQSKQRQIPRAVMFNNAVKTSNHTINFSVPSYNLSLPYMKI